MLDAAIALVVATALVTLARSKSASKATPWAASCTTAPRWITHACAAGGSPLATARSMSATASSIIVGQLREDEEDQRRHRERDRHAEEHRPAHPFGDPSRAAGHHSPGQRPQAAQ